MKAAEEAILSSRGESVEVKAKGTLHKVIIPDLENENHLYLSARTELVLNQRVTYIEILYRKFGRARQESLAYRPPYYFTDTAIAHAVLSKVVPLAQPGQTIFYTLPGLDNKIPYPQQGVSFAPISADSNPTQRLLHQAILEGITHA